MRNFPRPRGLRWALTGMVAAFAIATMAMTSPGWTAEDPGDAKSAAPAAEVAVGAPIDPKAMLDAQLRLGSRLVGKLTSAKPPQANVVVSPASLAIVFSLLDMGASEQMRLAIHRTLGFGDARETARRDIGATRSLATSIVRRANEGGPLALANIIVFDPASRPRAAAIGDLKKVGADVSVEGLSTPEAIAHINDWVKDKTRGLIPTVLNEAPKDAGLVAVNALYFKDSWKTPFDPGETHDRKFYLSGGGSIDVPMMHSQGNFVFRQNDKLVAVELSYATDDYKLVVVTSKDSPLDVNGFTAVEGWLGGQEFQMEEGELVLPRFSASGSEDLLPAVDALGLAVARKAQGALSGFTAISQTISRVVQKTELRLNEEGTEAAAATAVTATRSAVTSPTKYVKMIVDKPFMFALRDRRTGLVLLQGYVAKPVAITEASTK
jgi:serine protease inhibitor